MPRINKTDECDIIMPEHANGDIGSGYYYFPDDKRIAIDRFGNTLDMVTGKHSINSRNLNGLVIHVGRGDSFKSYKIEYIMARTFVGKHKNLSDKSYCGLVVNFIDGIKSHIRPENLEWVTVGQLSYMHKKYPRPTTNTPVLSYNLKTDDVTKWDSFRQAGIFFGLGYRWLWLYLMRGTFKKYHFNGFIFKFENGPEWDFDKNNLNELWKNRHPITFNIYDTVKNTTTRVSMVDISLFLNISLRDFHKARGLKKKFLVGLFTIEELL
jgi:hypothetical protein